MVYYGEGGGGSYLHLSANLIRAVSIFVVNGTMTVVYITLTYVVYTHMLYMYTHNANEQINKRGKKTKVTGFFFKIKFMVKNKTTILYKKNNKK